MRSASTETSPPAVGTTTGTWGLWALDVQGSVAGPSRAATSTKARRSAVLKLSRKPSSQKRLHAISRLFDRARFIASGQVPEGVADQGEGPGDTEDGGEIGRAHV